MFLEVENKNSDFLMEDYPVIAYKIKVDGASKLKIAGDKLTSLLRNNCSFIKCRCIYVRNI